MTDGERDAIVEAAQEMVARNGEPRGFITGYGRLYKAVMAMRPTYRVRIVGRHGNIQSESYAVEVTVEGAHVNLRDFEQHRKP